MFKDATSFLLSLAGIVATYYLVLLFIYRKKLVALFSKIPRTSAFTAQPSAQNDFPRQLIDRPMMGADTAFSISLDKSSRYDDVELEMVDDEENQLLKAAEIVVDKVQDVVSHIASHPPNPEEVYTKIKAIVSHYTIFHNTEYFDAINSFIVLTVERDCGIRFSDEQLLGLWQ